MLFHLFMSSSYTGGRWGVFDALNVKHISNFINSLLDVTSNLGVNWHTLTLIKDVAHSEIWLTTGCSQMFSWLKFSLLYVSSCTAGHLISAEEKT